PLCSGDPVGGGGGREDKQSAQLCPPTKAFPTDAKILGRCTPCLRHSPLEPRTHSPHTCYTLNTLDSLHLCTPLPSLPQHKLSDYIYIFFLLLLILLLSVVNQTDIYCIIFISLYNSVSLVISLFFSNVVCEDRENNWWCSCVLDTE
ncbi:hypothetical protein OTU49_012586, partial [Cherax quadricarinatus]